VSTVRVPSELFRRGVQLADLGIEERAWSRDDAAKVVKLLNTQSVAVLGGDIYLKTGAGFEPTYENWFCASRAEETPRAFASRSHEESAAYLAGLHTSTAGETWVTLVLTEALANAESDEPDVEETG